MRTNPKAFLALLGILLLGACGGDASTGVNGDASGTYTLQSINSNPLPYTVATGATTTLTFKSGSLTIGTDNTFSETLDLDENDTASGSTTSTTSTCVGTYSQRGNGFTFSESSSADPNCGFTYGGAWNGSNAFTVTFAPGASAYYTK
ncbi:MAG TPA: hypothetical protein VGQ98_02015 [Gemmatimonadaceae bacterium]|nr:hypothetical protein [Gemmatimonadaceae bacterium]